MNTPQIDLRADLNAEDDEGLNWSLLRDAGVGMRIIPGAVIVAGVQQLLVSESISGRPVGTFA